MLQSMLQRNPLTSTGSSNRAHIEELPSDTVSTFSEDGQCYTCSMIFTYVRSGIYCMLLVTLILIVTVTVTISDWILENSSKSHIFIYHCHTNYILHGI